MFGGLTVHSCPEVDEHCADGTATGITGISYYKCNKYADFFTYSLNYAVSWCSFLLKIIFKKQHMINCFFLVDFNIPEINMMAFLLCV